MLLLAVTFLLNSGSQAVIAPLTLVGTILCAGIAWFAYWRTNPRRRLDYTVTTLPLPRVRSELAGRAQVMVDGRRIDGGSVVTVKVLNGGRADINTSTILTLRALRG